MGGLTKITVRLIQPGEHGKVGDVVELIDADGCRLIAIGAAERVTQEPTKTKSKPTRRTHESD